MQIALNVYGHRNSNQTLFAVTYSYKIKDSFRQRFDKILNSYSTSVMVMVMMMIIMMIMMMMMMKCKKVPVSYDMVTSAWQLFS